MNNPTIDTSVPPTSQTQTPRRRRHIIRWVIIALLAVLAVSVIAFVVWASNPLGPAPEAIAALNSTESVQVTTDDWLTFTPKQSQPTAGFIFYPGGRVDYRSYAPTAQLIAEAGYLVVIPPMPLNLAVFGLNAASEIMDAHPEITDWAIGGHSLGGAMAAQFVHDNPSLIDGLALWAAYPAAGGDLSAANLAAVSIFGSNDGVATPADIEASRPLLPANTNWVQIDGGNHAQFGAYGPQPGDGVATISAEQQHQQTAAATIELLAGLN